MGYLKGKSTLMLYDLQQDLQSNWDKAFWARGYYVETICNKLVRVVDTVEPEPELVAKYEEKYRKFRKLYQAMKELFR